MTGNRQGRNMGDDRRYDRDNRWGVEGELSQKAGYYNYFSCN